MKFTATDLIESTQNLADKQEALRDAQAELTAAEKLDEAIRLNLFGPSAARNYARHSSFIQQHVDDYLIDNYETPDKRFAFLQRVKELFEQYDECTTVDLDESAEPVALLLIAGRDLPDPDSATGIRPHDIAIAEAHSSRDGAAELAEKMIEAVNRPDYWRKKS